MKKKLIVLIIVMMVLCLFPAQIFGQQTAHKAESDVGILWTFITEYRNYFEVSSNGQALANVRLYASSNIDKVVIDASIQQYANGNWKTIKSWTSTSYSSSGYLNQTWYVNKGYYYRLVSTGKVYQNDALVEQTSYTGPSYWY